LSCFCTEISLKQDNTWRLKNTLLFPRYEIGINNLMKRSNPRGLGTSNQGLIDFLTLENIEKAKQPETRCAQTPVCS